MKMIFYKVKRLAEKYKSSLGDEIPERDMTYHLI